MYKESLLCMIQRADICCMSSMTFQKIFPLETRYTKLAKISSLSASSKTKLDCDRIFPIPFKIDNQKFVFNDHVFTNLKEEFILGINFFQTVGLGYDPCSRELYWMDKSDSTWSTANLQCYEKITIEPTTNKVVTLNVITSCRAV